LIQALEVEIHENRMEVTRYLNMFFGEEHKRQLLLVSAALMTRGVNSETSCLLITELDAHNLGIPCSGND
jgi:hypothetical protein